MADIVFKDRNGASWLILTGGTAVFATPDPASAIRYDPMPEDLGPVTAKGGDAPGALEIDALKTLINAWAGQHAQQVVLQVTPARGSGVGWFLLLAVLLIASDINASAKR